MFQLENIFTTFILNFFFHVFNVITTDNNNFKPGKRIVPKE